MLIDISQKILNYLKNIEIIYSPKFNLIERLWLHTKQNILYDKVYNIIALLEGTLYANLLFLFLTSQLNNSIMSLT